MQEPPSQVGLAVKQLAWGTNYNLLAVNTVREVFVLREHQISAHYNQVTHRLTYPSEASITYHSARGQEVAAVQTSPTRISVYLDSDKLDPESVSVLTADIQVRGLFVTRWGSCSRDNRRG